MTDATARTPALLTDLYQLTMIVAYFELRMERVAVFEFFVRRMPQDRGFLLTAGLEQAIAYLEGLRFEPHEIDWLAATGRFKPSALERIANLRFTGDVDAMPEGTVCFAQEPVLRVTAPLPEAQLVESRLINLLNFQTMIASKAMRCRFAAQSRRLADFGMRRAHGAEAAVVAARACYVAGFDATATVEAGRLFGIPLTGTMAHSFILASSSEAAAFRNFAGCHPQAVTLLIDTYDTLAAAHEVVELYRSGISIDAVRLDSGDLDALSHDVRSILDRGGCGAVQIIASGDVDEFRIDELARAGAPIDGYGVGTQLAVSADAPYLDCVYKLQQYDGVPRRKRSTAKATWPGRKQVFRKYDDQGRIAGDVLGLHDESIAGRPLLEPVMRRGVRVAAAPTLEAIRARAVREAATLPDHCRSIRDPSPLEVEISAGVQRLTAEADRLVTE